MNGSYKKGVQYNFLNYILFSIVILLGAFFRFKMIGKRTLWLDECITAIDCAESWLVILPGFYMGTSLYKILAKFFCDLFQYNDFWVRFPSALMGSLSLILIFIVGKKMFNSTVGFIAATLLAFNQLHIFHSLEARYYSIMVFMSLLLLLIMVKILEKPYVKKYWLLLIIVSVLNMHTHFLQVLYVAIVWTYLIGILLIKYSGRILLQESLIKRILFFSSVGLLCALMIGGGLHAFQFVVEEYVLYEEVDSYLGAMSQLLERPHLESFDFSFNAYKNLHSRIFLRYHNLEDFAIYLTGVFLLIGLVFLIIRKKIEVIFLFVWVATLFGLFWLLRPEEWGFYDRYAISALIGYIFLIALGISQIWRGLKKMVMKFGGQKIVPFLPFLVVTALMITMYPSIDKTLTVRDMPRSNWNRALRYLEKYNSDDVLFLVMADSEEMNWHYYWYLFPRSGKTLYNIAFMPSTPGYFYHLLSQYDKVFLIENLYDIDNVLHNYKPPEYFKTDFENYSTLIKEVQGINIYHVDREKNEYNISAFNVTQPTEIPFKLLSNKSPVFLNVVHPGNYRLRTYGHEDDFHLYLENMRTGTTEKVLSGRKINLKQGKYKVGIEEDSMEREEFNIKVYYALDDLIEMHHSISSEVKLIGYEIIGDPVVSTGEDLHYLLFFKALDTPSKDYLMNFQIFREGRRLYRKEFMPGLRLNPMHTWEPDDIYTMEFKSKVPDNIGFICFRLSLFHRPHLFRKKEPFVYYYQIPDIYTHFSGKEQFQQESFQEELSDNFGQARWFYRNGWYEHVWNPLSKIIALDNSNHLSAELFWADLNRNMKNHVKFLYDKPENFEAVEIEFSNGLTMKGYDYQIERNMYTGKNMLRTEYLFEITEDFSYEFGETFWLEQRVKIEYNQVELRRSTKLHYLRYYPVRWKSEKYVVLQTYRELEPEWQNALIRVSLLLGRSGDMEKSYYDVEANKVVDEIFPLIYTFHGWDSVLLPRK